MHQLTRNIHDVLGPVVDAIICVTEARSEALAKAKLLTPERIQGLLALVDTGADTVAIDTIYASQLLLPVHTPSRFKAVDEYKWRFKCEVGVILLCNEGRLLFDTPCYCFDNLKTRTGVDLIIGRDVLSRFRFEYNGPDQNFELCYDGNS
jgi:hypothetical protein